DHVEYHHCNYNWKTFIEVYLEDYHVAPFHPGLGRFVTCDDLRWEFSDWYSAQRVGVSQAFGTPGSEVYRKWHDHLLEYRGGQEPDFGAVWVTYFPTHMIEIYPHVLVLSTLHPVGPQETVNVVEFYYPEDIAAFEREFVEAQQAAYMETAGEDDEIAERMDAGRRALMMRGSNEMGPYQSPMEDGMQHLHEWYRRMMGDALGARLGWPASRVTAHDRPSNPASALRGIGGRRGGRHGLALHNARFAIRAPRGKQARSNDQRHAAPCHPVGHIVPQHCGQDGGEHDGGVLQRSGEQSRAQAECPGQSQLAY